ncbi:uncharacterized protein LOC113316080 [Papaver somniferum]|uniref:uncharacterized protein LOC113316080 n=1 Tax=Papaver somniferum TaxID=3469 RepID=UPI000E70542C|nr:uncharacterized protein LOC113316080 [Papaver somniferum]
MQSMQGLTSMLQQNQQKTNSTIKALEIQVEQLAADVNLLKAQASKKLPSQPFVNPRESVNAISLSSGKQVEQPNQQDEVHEKLVEDKEETTPKETSKEPVPTFTTPPPIRQIPRYAKFLKELCMKKKRLKGNEFMSVGENASAFILKKLQPKLKDPGSFSIPCTIGKTRFTRALLDLGASVNVMPSSIYDSLNLGPLKETGVNDLGFPTDFYVLNMNDENSPKSTPLLLGRPFLSTAGTKIDVQNGTFTMEFDGAVIHFNIFETMRYPGDVKSCFPVKEIDAG